MTVFWLCLNGRSHPFSGQKAPAYLISTGAGFLLCFSFDSEETETVQFICRVGSGGGEVQCIGLCGRGKGDGRQVTVAGAALVCLPRTWGQYPDAGHVLFSSSPYGRIASI